MSKRSIKFSIMLVAITAGLSVLFIVSSLLIDLFAQNELLSDAFYYIRTAFDLIAEYTAFGVVIYAFCRYNSFKQAWPSTIIAIGSFIFSLFFQIGSTAIFEASTNTKLSAGDIWGNIAIDFVLGLLGTFIERLLPCAFIALITYFCTKNGTAKITKLFSFKNSVQRAMFFSVLTMYLINAVPTLVLNIMDIISIGGTKNMYFEEFMLQVIMPHISIILYNFILQYAIYLLVYFLCQKHAESAPIKKTNKSENKTADAVVTSEEK